MMGSQKPTHLPSVHEPVQNNKQLLFNDVRLLLLECDVGFHPDEVDGIGFSFMNAVVDTLWYIDGQYDKFESRHKHGKVPVIPDIFTRFNKGGENNKGGYNDWVAKRKKSPQMEKRELMAHANKLITVVSHPRLATKRWSLVRNATEGLAKAVRAYVDDMEQSMKRSEEKHKSLHSCRNPDIDTESRDIPTSKMPAKPIYSRLLTRLESVDFYEPVLVNDDLSVKDKFARHRFFSNLELPYSVHLFQYHAGSHIGNISYI